VRPSYGAWGVVLLCLLPLVFLPETEGKRGADIVAGPYLQQVTSSEITFRWITDRPATENRVYWGLSPHNLTLARGAPNREWHEVTVTGLQPSTSYWYRVTSDDMESSLYTFRTAPGNEDSVTIIAYGDSRGVWDDWRNASLVARAIEQERARVVINTGDLVASGGEEEQWIRFFQVASFSHNATLYPALGNHDLPAGNLRRFFSLPHNERWYAVDYGPCHLVVLDSTLPYGLSLGQYLWLLSAVQTEKPWTVVVFHHPPYSSGAHGGTLHTRLLWAPLFRTQGVDLVLNGHDHDYEHLIVQGLHYVVTGGGGAPLRPVGSGQWTQQAHSTYHYCRVTASGSALEVAALEPDGKLLDRFTVGESRGAGMPRACGLSVWWLLWYAACTEWLTIG